MPVLFTRTFARSIANLPRLPDVTVHRRFRVLDIGQRHGWHIDDVGAPHAWSRDLSGHGVRVGVIDTGIDEDHLEQNGDLYGRAFAVADFTRSRHGARDRLGHGTHVAGIIAANDNLSGIRGVAYKSKLAIAKALGDGGSGSSDGIADAIDWCASDQKCHVINLSLGSPAPSSRINDAIDRANAAGVHVVCAAGNAGDRQQSWPAMHPGTISVGATGRDRRPANFSSPSNVTVAAPGVRIESTYLDGAYAELSGTSMSAPIVTGMIALYVGWELSMGITRLSANAMRKRVEMASIDVWTPGRDGQTGHGLISAEKYFDDVKEPPADPPASDDSKTYARLYIGEQLVRWPVESFPFPE